MKEENNDGDSITYTYNEDGQLVLKTGEGSYPSTTEYEYDAAGNLIHDKTIYGTSVYETDYTYDENGNVVKSVTYEKDDEKEETITSEYINADYREYETEIDLSKYAISDEDRELVKSKMEAVKNLNSEEEISDYSEDQVEGTRTTDTEELIVDAELVEHMGLSE